MSWLQTVMGALLIMAQTGCPSEFGKEGRIAKAVHKDAVERVTERCSDEQIEQVCGNGREDTPECQQCFE
jgi:hypothetical protein